MNKQFKEILVMNLMYNLLLAYILEMVIALGLPFSKWGMNLANKYAEPGTLKYRLLMTTGTAIPFAIAMCLGMSFINVVENGKVIGYEMQTHITYYRGIPLSMINYLKVAVDGVEVPEEDIRFTPDGIDWFTLKEIKRAAMPEVILRHGCPFNFSLSADTTSRTPFR